MKKLLFVAMILALALVLTACSGKKETSAPAAEPTAVTAAEEPTAAPADEPAAEVDLSAIMTGFGLDENMMKLDASLMLDNYGIEAADMKQFAAAVNTSGTKADEIVLVEAVDAAAAARIKEALDNRYQNKLNETENYLPDEYAVIKTCSVQQSGNFVSMIVAPNAQELTAAYSAAVR